MTGKPVNGINGRKARILVVDDHPLVRAGLFQVINLENDLECCGQADSQDLALSAVETCKPDLVTIDIRLRKGDGLNLIKAINAQYPSLPTLVISQCDESLYAERALKAGARGYLMKERATGEVIAAIRTVLKGGVFVSPQIAAIALEKLVGGKTAKQDDHAINTLTNRELQIFQLLGSGLSTRKIAEKLFLSVKTVEAHREHIKHKLGLSNAAELNRYSAEWVNGLSPHLLPGSLESGATQPLTGPPMN